MAEKNIPVTHEGRDMSAREESRLREGYLKPAVDIFETEEGLTLVADLPGVSQEQLEVDIVQGVLTLRGKAESAMGGDDLYREFSRANYYRQFQIPNEIEIGRVTAELKDGVLTLQLPKAEAAKPRRIEITTH
jgi:HSP20 family molecular chaperone IbpA